MQSVQQDRVDLVNALITREVNDIIGLGSHLANCLDTGDTLNDTPDGDAPRLYQIYHHHEYGGTLYLVWSDHDPTEEEIVEQVLQAPFESDKQEWITVDKHEGEIKVLKEAS